MRTAAADEIVDDAEALVIDQESRVILVPPIELIQLPEFARRIAPVDGLPQALASSVLAILSESLIEE